MSNEKYQGREVQSTIQAPDKPEMDKMIRGMRRYAKKEGLGPVKVLQKGRDPDGGYKAIVVAHNWNPIQWAKEKFASGRTAVAEGRTRRRGERKEEKETKRQARLAYISSGAEAKAQTQERLARIKEKGETKRARIKEKASTKRTRMTTSTLGKMVPSKKPAGEEMIPAGKAHIMGLKGLRELTAPPGLTRVEEAAWEEIKQNDDVDTRKHIVSELAKEGYGKKKASQAVTSLHRKGIVRKVEGLEGEPEFEITIRMGGR